MRPLRVKTCTGKPHRRLQPKNASRANNMVKIFAARFSLGPFFTPKRNVILLLMAWSTASMSMEADALERPKDRHSLFQAIKDGDLPAVQRLYQDLKEITHDDQGRTKLFNAVLYGQLPIVTFLLDQGEDVNGTNWRRFRTVSQGSKRIETEVEGTQDGKRVLAFVVKRNQTEMSSSQSGRLLQLKAAGGNSLAMFAKQPEPGEPGPAPTVSDTKRTMWGSQPDADRKGKAKENKGQRSAEDEDSSMELYLKFTEFQERREKNRTKWMSLEEFPLGNEESKAHKKGLLGHCGGFLLEKFASDKELVLKRTRANRNGKEKGEDLMEEIRHHGGVYGSVKVDASTPIFALAAKELTATDLEIARLLIDSGATLDEENLAHKTPVIALEDKLKSLFVAATPATPRCGSDFKVARREFFRAEKDRSVGDKLSQYWRFLASSSSTTRVIALAGYDQQGDDNENSLPFLDHIVRWTLDNNMLTPQQAWDRYAAAQSYLSSDLRFEMLLRYLIIWTNLATSKEEGPSVARELSSALTLEDVTVRKPKNIAMAIYIVDREMFLSIKPEDIAIKYCRTETTPQLSFFLKRLDHMTAIVAYSIANSRKPTKMFNRWRRVAKELLKLNDLFGCRCIRSGLESPAVKRTVGALELDDLPDLSKYKNYVAAKNDRRHAGVIPTIVEEGSLLMRGYEGLTMVDGGMPIDGEESVPFMIDAFIDDLRQLQGVLLSADFKGREEFPEIRDLCEFFGDLTSMEKRYKAAELVSLRAANTPRGDHGVKGAEHWDAKDLFDWVTSVIGDKKKYIDRLAQAGISDGPSFLVKFVIAQGPRYDELEPKLLRLFAPFEGWSQKNRNACALSDLSYEGQFPVDMMAHEEDAFLWLMWLRNQGISRDTIIRLFGHGLENFKQFIEIRLEYPMADRFYTDCGVVLDKDIVKLEHLNDLRDVIAQGFASIDKWQLPQLDAWLFRQGLSHLIPLIEEDAAWTSDHLLSFYYFFQKFKARKFRELGLNSDWTGSIFNELALEHDLKGIIDKGANRKLGMIGPSEKESRLFFIRALAKLDAIAALPSFYADGIQTLNELKQKLFAKIDLGQSSSPGPEKKLAALNPLDLTLVRYGLVKRQIDKIKKWLH